MIVYPFDEPMPPEQVFRIGYRTALGGGQSWPGGATQEDAEGRLSEKRSVYGQLDFAGRRPAEPPRSWYIERVTFYRRTELVSEVQA